MTGITDRELLRSIEEGFDKALDATESILGVKNRMTGPGRLSAKFVWEVGSAVHRRLLRRSPALRLRAIEVDEFGEKKPGEWLVDACVTEDHGESANQRFIDRIVFAMESESHPGQTAFNVDFAKLLHLNARCRLYLNGLKQTTPEGMWDYMRRRRGYVEAILNRTRPCGEVYVGFWPSPAKPRNSDDPVDSIWRRLQGGQWPHLNGIRLWRFDKDAGKLIEV